MPTPRPTDYAAIVRAHATLTTGFVLADSGDCLDIQGAEVARIKRALRPLRSADLADLKLPASWLLGIILCPGDSTRLLAAWAATLDDVDLSRIRFYHHDACDLVGALAAWYAAGLDDPRADEVRDFATFHKLFGNDLNDQIYADAGAGPS